MSFSLFIAMVKNNKTDRVVDAAKKAGATGATIVPAHGAGGREAKTFFGLVLEEQTDIVLMLLEECWIDPVLEAVRTAGEFHKPGTGIAFILPVDRVAGLESQLERAGRKTSC